MQHEKRTRHTEVLVTGGAGFIGRALTAALIAAGSRVTVLTRNPAGPRARELAGLGAVLLPGDLGSDASLAALAGAGRPALVCHLAADVSVSGSGLCATNVDGTRRVLEAAEQLGAEYFLHASSIEAQGPGSLEEGERDADAPCRPVTPYGESKLASEELVRAWSASTGRPASILRIGNIYGPGSPWLVRPALFALAGAAPLAPIHRAIAGSRLQPLYVDDLVRALVRVIAARLDGTFLVPGETAVTLGALLERLAELVGLESNLAAIAADDGASRFAGGSPDPDFAYFLIGHPERPHRVYDGSRLHAAIGSYAQRPLVRGLAATLAWAYSSGALAPLATPAVARGDARCTQP